jgi:crotonobetainyl-CoA:carnitine CoA-transferase CaiB-like acyl-CoA transferase
MMSDPTKTIIALRTSLARQSRREGDVEHACELFHAAHAAMAAITDGYDYFETPEFKQWRSVRDAAFGEIRGRVAHTSNALLAKIGVFRAMRDWLTPDDPGLSAFAVEIVTEAAALLDTDLAPMCASEAYHH